MMEKKVKKPNIFYVISITLGIFVVSFGLLAVLGLAPESVTPIEHNASIVENVEESVNIESDTYTRPDRIIVDTVGIDSKINQPRTGDVSVLDQALLNGAVHYPGSGSVENGNMFIFGHSTNWKVVQNEAYKTFNNLEKVEKGDEIKIVADGVTYIYKVNSVDLVDEDSALVVFDSSEKTLTISTCNTFGEKQERWVVKAEFDRKV